MHTSTVTVAVLPEPTAAQVVLREDDLEFTACRGSGAGGQHRNVTASAVQLKHKPQHPVSGRVLRTKVDREIADRGFGHGGRPFEIATSRALASSGASPNRCPDFGTLLRWSHAVLDRHGLVRRGSGQRLGIKEVDDGIWLASFMHFDLGYFDLEQKTLQPLDNPFGPRLSPMS